MLVGIDTGGTFTDLVAFDSSSGGQRIFKVASTPAAPATAVGTALSESGIDLSHADRLIIGTTIVINAVLQRKGADVVLLATDGFEDLSHIQRINRPTLYDLQWNKGRALVRRAHTVGVKERIDARGQVVLPLEEHEVDRVVREAGALLKPMADPAFAICLLFSFKNSAHETQLEEALQSHFPSVPVSLSSRICPIWREYERSSTTIADAYVQPIIRGFAGELERTVAQSGLTCPVSLMKSNGGQVPLRTAATHSAQLLLSGLAGGLLAGKYYAETLNRSDLITLDMGGTSADVGVVRDREISFRDSYDIEWAVPIIGSFVDMTTIGAGGSSMAGFDRGGLLRVGPESAGADPGPAAYGFGGSEPTVTDANIVLGRLDPDYFLGGRMQLDPTRAAAAVGKIAERLDSPLEDAALSIVRMANENMANAIRLVTADRGLDPREFELLAFGGAGSLHAAEVAAALGMRHVIVPTHPGLASAFGLIAASPRVDRSRTCSLDSESNRGAELEAEFTRLVDEVRRDLAEDGYLGDVALLRSVSMRYVGQNYEQEIPLPGGAVSEGTIPTLVARYHEAHQAAYGYSMLENSCELAQINVVAIGASERPALARLTETGVAEPSSVRGVFFADAGWVDSEVYVREKLGAGAELRGPAVIAEPDSTTVVHPDQLLTVDEYGFLHLEAVSVGAERSLKVAL